MGGARRKRVLAGWSVILGLVLLLAGQVDAARGVVEANTANPGELFEVKKVVSRSSKFTLVDFYSPACPPCRKLAPLLEALARKRQDIRVVKLNINRAGAAGIDWKSPLAQQYGIRSVPFLLVFDPGGRVVAEGQGAKEMVKKWMQEAGM